MTRRHPPPPTLAHVRRRRVAVAEVEALCFVIFCIVWFSSVYVAYFSLI